MRLTWPIALLSSTVLFAGCSGMPGITPTATTPKSVQGAAIQGKVFGGQQALVGASVYMYAANNTGYGSPSVSLLKNTAVITNTEGQFNITGDYTCPSATSQVYLYSIGGNSGSGPNSASGLLAALGTCPANGTLSSSLYIVINEVSTIATAYAIAGYATDATHVSSSGSALATTGIANAFATAANLETLGTGVALAATPTVNGGYGTVPQTEINTLANILAACTNSNGAVTGGASPTPCYTLFTNALSGGTTGTQPTDTATAAINIAHNPGANIANLYPLSTPISPFQHTLATQPNDFAIAISYTGGGMDSPYGIAIDASDNVWVTNYNNSAVNSISEFTPTGVPISPTGCTAGGLSQPEAIAIDSSGDVWATNTNASTISELTSCSTGSSYTTSELNTPVGIAIDASGKVWVANLGNNSISEFSGGSWTSITDGGLDGPVRIAIDTYGDVWVLNAFGSYSLSEFVSSTGLPVSSTGYYGGGVSSPESIAIDAVGNAWVANYGFGSNSLSEFCPPALCPSSGFWNFNFSSGSPYTGGGLNSPYDIAIDGAGDVWVVNLGNESISEFSSSGLAISGSNGYVGGAGGVLGSQFLAIDGSGNLWATNIANSTLIEFVGMAVPVVTPIVANLITPYSANNSAVNKP